jgi:hypothetical protein
MKFLLKLRPVDWILVASICVLLVVFGLLMALSSTGATSGVGLGVSEGVANANVWIGFYTHALAGSFAGFFYGAVVFVCLIVIALVIWSLGGGLLMAVVQKFRVRKMVPDTFFRDPREVFLAAARRSREVLLVIPIFIFVGLAGIAMGEANLFDRVRLADTTVAGWEHALFGNYVFAILGAIPYPHWFILFIIWSFENMAIIMVVAGIILAYTAVARFHEFLIALCIGILAMIPIWLLLPALSPQDRFINNVYQLPVPSQIAQAIANYHPQQEILDFYTAVRADKNGLPALPTSTVPSAHVFWAVLTGYYLFRAGSGKTRSGRVLRWLAWIALPFLIASSYGTVLLAQHYFIDVPAGIAVALLAIWLAHDIEILSPEAKRLRG